MFSRFKWPREYAAEIIALPTREARADALNRVPEDVREWVKFYVTDHYTRRVALKRYHRQQAAAC